MFNLTSKEIIKFYFVLRALLKTEVESAINGKQWLLSCFGPFKESICIPNLADRSFEEVRLDFLEANKNGNVQQHVSELVSQYNDSMTKLNQLKLAAPDTIQLVANIYNQSVQSDSALSNTHAAQPQSKPNPFQMGSVFGGSQQQQPAMNAGSIFGGSTAVNTFQPSNQSSIFGAPKEQPTTAASNFSFSLGQQAPQTSIFGAAQPQTTQQNSIFGSSAQPMQQLQPSQSVFGASNFAIPSSIFSSAASQQQPQLPPQGNSIFGSSMFAQSPPAPPVGLFASVQSVPPQSSTFAQPATNNIFGGFQPQPEVQQQNSGNIFAQSIAQPIATVAPQTVFSMQQEAPAAPPVFQIQPPATANQQPFGQNPFQTQPPVVDESAYSRPEDLTPEEIQAFQSETFQIEQIPLKPPPRNLCF